MTPTGGEGRGLLRRLFGRLLGTRPQRVTSTAELEANLEAAVTTHDAWKARLLEAVIVGSSPVSPAVASVDNKCPFGIWLYQECDSQIRESPQYEYIRRLHGRFHVMAGAILRQAVGEQQREAIHAVRYGGEFDQMSAELIAAINNWRDSVQVR